MQHHVSPPGKEAVMQLATVPGCIPCCSPKRTSACCGMPAHATQRHRVRTLYRRAKATSQETARTGPRLKKSDMPAVPARWNEMPAGFASRHRNPSRVSDRPLDRLVPPDPPPDVRRRHEIPVKATGLRAISGAGGWEKGEGICAF